jgi:hypothetical protein
VQSLRTTLLDDISTAGRAEGEARRRAAGDRAGVLTDKQMFLMTRTLCLYAPDRLHDNARPASHAAPAERQYVLQDDDDVDEDDDDDDVDDDDTETDEDEAEDEEEEEEETWQVSAIAPFR